MRFVDKDEAEEGPPAASWQKHSMSAARAARLKEEAVATQAASDAASLGAFVRMADSMAVASIFALVLRATGDLVSAISVRSTSRTPLWSMALGFRKHALRDSST